MNTQAAYTAADAAFLAAQDAAYDARDSYDAAIARREAVIDAGASADEIAGAALAAKVAHVAWWNAVQVRDGAFAAYMAAADAHLG